MKGHVAVFTGPGKPMEIREYPVPDPGPDDVVVRIRRANICGSDLHIWRGHGPPFPRHVAVVSGHEMVGEILMLGRDVKHDCQGEPLREGDRIAYAYFLRCGACGACLDGSPACPNRYRHWLGAGAETPPHFRGAYGEFYYLRKGQTICRVPSELPDDVVSPVNFLRRRRGVYPFERIVSHTYPFARINDAFGFASEGRAIRVSLAMG